jgi:hypothetical protein
MRWFGLIVTVVWLFGGSFYIFYHEGWSQFINLDPNAHGDFFAGLFAPIAFLWLVIGYLQQTAELRMQREELEMQRKETGRLADESSRQSISIEENLKQSRRDVFLKTKELVDFEIEEVARRIHGPVMPMSRQESMADTFLAGDRDVYVRGLNDRFNGASQQEIAADLNRDDKEFHLALQIKALFEFLLDEAKKADDSLSLFHVVESSQKGVLYSHLDRAISHFA